MATLLEAARDFEGPETTQKMRAKRKARRMPQVQPLLPVFRTADEYCIVDGVTATELHFHALRIDGGRMKPHCLCDPPRNRGKRRARH